MSLKTLVLASLCFVLTGFEANAIDPAPVLPDTSNQLQARFDPDLATQQYIDQMSGEKKAQSDAYFEGGYWLLLWNMLYEIVVAWIFLSLGLSGWIKKLALKARNVNLQNLAYAACYLVFAYILFFPLSVYQGYFREHQYNLSNLSFGGWFGEEMISLALNLVLGSLVITLLYIAMRKVKAYWWLWGAGVGMVFLVVVLFLGPVFIAPLFNKYKSLDEGPVKEQILSMARANGVPAKNVFQFDASRQSNRVSANVSGIGSTIRVSLNDNLLNRCSPSEIRAVMAHELGHYVLNHTFYLLLQIGLLLVLGFAFVNWAFRKAINRWGERWRITSIADIGGLPLFMVLFSLFFFFATPAMNNISRVTELEADYFGLNAAREPDGFAKVTMKLSEYRKISPGHWEEIIFYDHPSGKTRIRNAMHWKAENLEK